VVTVVNGQNWSATNLWVSGGAPLKGTDGRMWYVEPPAPWTHNGC
jgi:hypothetical protein